jgi:hypothetical protein
MLTNQENVVTPISTMSEAKKIEILAFINAEWNDFDTKVEMGKEIEHSYIFGPLGQNQHFNIDDIMSLINEVDLQKNPPIIEEVVVEEPALETNV